MRPEFNIQYNTKPMGLSVNRIVLPTNGAANWWGLKVTDFQTITLLWGQDNIDPESRCYRSREVADYAEDIDPCCDVEINSIELENGEPAILLTYWSGKWEATPNSPYAYTLIRFFRDTLIAEDDYQAA